MSLTEKALQAKREYNRKYKKEHREDINAYQRQYRKEHKDKIKEYQERYWNRAAE